MEALKIMISARCVLDEVTLTKDADEWTSHSENVNECAETDQWRKVGWF